GRARRRPGGRQGVDHHVSSSRPAIFAPRQPCPGRRPVTGRCPAGELSGTTPDRAGRCRRGAPPSAAAERGPTSVRPAAPGRTTPGNDETLARVSAGQGFVSEPPVGIEPTTYSLRVNRSAD